ncbi:membrane-bound lytic murein transglycosylase MltF [Psychromonas sp. MME2]|uniref:membrane-bound lytic murein transglycosylase MltF n=1 Tax=Psychromonas sp. MME2 TaxID=3231033 RepID=UPI00339C9AE1
MCLTKLSTAKKYLAISALLLMLCACNPLSPKTSLQKVQARGDIIMGTMNGSLTYSFDGQNHSGFDYELAKQFAEYLNVRLTIKEYDTLNELFNALDNNKIDFIGSSLTLTPKRAKKYRSSPPYYYVSQKLVYRNGSYRPREVADINAPVGVLKDSSHEETLKALIKKGYELQINIFEHEDQETLLREIANKKIPFAIVDSYTLAQKQRFYPVLTEAFTIAKKQPVAWLINRNQDDTIYSAMIEFMGNKYSDQTIARLEEKYFGHIENFDFVDMRTFIKRIKTTLPKYEDLFKKYATSEVDWLLLAAVSYQESHWDPKSISPTGVRGLMMLTLDTANYVGIDNRLNPEQSIKGGAKYLSQQINRLPDSIPEDEKVWFALASYNIGYGHLMDARRITSIKKQNPNSWTDVKENLPLLHQKKWYTQTRYGYARGKEAQSYVDNIRQYQKTITWYMADKEKKRIQAEALKTAQEQELAEKKAIEDAQQKNFAEQQNWQTPLNKKQILLYAKQVNEESQKTLQQTKENRLATEQALQLAEQNTVTQQEYLKAAQQKLQEIKNAIQQTNEKALAEQTALQEAQEKALADEQKLQLAKQELENKQQQLIEVIDIAIAEQQQLKQAQEAALAEELKAQQAQQETAAELEKIQQMQYEESVKTNNNDQDI